jgi:23S rRNA pseudouridine2605 synthase
MPRRVGLARVLSKLGVCSRSRAAALIREARVSVDGRIERDPERPTDPSHERISVDGIDIQPPPRLYLALNKPRGVVVSAADERGRTTVYALLESAGLPWVAPVGRLDKASEGLLLLSNDPEWAAGVTDPEHGLTKTYHVQVRPVPSPQDAAALVTGFELGGERLAAVAARVLRAGRRNAWLEIVLDEGRNRQIRRLLDPLGYEVLRLVRVAIGTLALGELGKGQWQILTGDEVRELGSGSRRTARARCRRA